MIDLGDLAAAVAARVTDATDLRAAADRAPRGWQVAGDDGEPYVTVRAITANAARAGDGRVTDDVSRVEVSLWAHRDDDDPAHVPAIVAALDGVKLDGHRFAGRVIGATRVPTDESDVLRTVVEVRYPLPRDS